MLNFVRSVGNTKGILYQSAGTIALLLASFQIKLQWYITALLLVKRGLLVAQEPVLILQLEEMQQGIDEKISTLMQSKQESLHDIQELIGQV